MADVTVTARDWPHPANNERKNSSCNLMEDTSDSNLLSPFERCPNEILSRVHHFLAFDYPNRQSIFALRLTSRCLYSFFTQHAIDEVRFSLGVKEELSEVIAGKYNSASDRPLVEPAPDSMVHFISSVRIYFFGFNEVRPEVQTPETAHSLVQQLQQIWDELGRYTSLRDLEVHWVDHGAKKGLGRPIYEHLANELLRSVHEAANGKLNRLYWFFPHALGLSQPIPKSFRQSLDFREWVVEAHYFNNGLGDDESNRTTTSLLGNIVSYSPSLCSISFLSRSPYPVCKWEELFPPELDQLAVESIRIKGFLPNAPQWFNPQSGHSGSSLHLSSPPMTPKLPHLRELYIRAIIPRESAINLDPLWMTLRTSNACLTSLTLEYGLSDLLADYLASYSGLSHWKSIICLPPITLSTSFITKIVPRHTSSLVKLHLRSWVHSNRLNEDPNWDGIAIDPSTWPNPSSFINLTKLDIVALRSWDLTPGRCQYLLDYIIEMPKLRTFSVEWMQGRYQSTDTGTTSIQGFGELLRDIGERVSIRRCALRQFMIERTYEIDVGEWVGNMGGWRIAFPCAENPEVEGQPLLLVEGANGRHDHPQDIEERFPLRSFEFSCNLEDSDED
ncbi:hypothetical protein AX16_010538 [Volvariella volvacea WC 439]|nr:hypothetical protein AX16_010538 [Volvariella volvacea WC 439]